MIGARAAGLVMALVLAGAGSAETPGDSPRPKVRPETAVAAAAAAEGSGSVPARRPKPRPAVAERVEIGPPAFGAAVPAVRPLPRPPAAERAPVVQAAAATRALPALAFAAPPVRPDAPGAGAAIQPVAWRAEPPIASRKGSVCGIPTLRGRVIAPIAAKVRGCGLHDGVEVTSVSGIALSTPATIDCPTARALSAWVDGGLKPVVRNLGGGPVALELGPSYACRPRNNQAGNRISEHGRGAALDIMGIRLANGVVLSVLEGWGSASQGRILKALHHAACGPFTTVLGPAANSFHRNHFHFDTARGRGPYCH